ncbi:VTT domain-containing protein [Anaerosolibacter carboniphilus]|uniref:VTT domain-containing protein n=1 Tax=Anaerosolibacter carboniphilus TaxID=1417629 RepID=UPI001FADD5D3|nr:VTT domain-containing protein [Anaerosolibacter carboniphilus]
MSTEKVPFFQCFWTVLRHLIYQASSIYSNTERFINPKLLNKYEQHFSSKKGKLLLMLLLFLPFFPDDASGFIAGLSKISLRRYVIIMLLTRPCGVLAV